MKILSFIRPGRKARTLSGFSIQQRLPLLICILLLGVMITFGLISYFSVRKSALETGRERLQSLSEQLSAMLSQSAQSVVAANKNTANDPEVKNYLNLLSEAPDSATDALSNLLHDSSTVMIELLDKDFRPLLRVAKNNMDQRFHFDSLLINKVRMDTGRISKLYRLNDSIFYAVNTSIFDRNQVAGYLLRWRLVRNTSGTVERLKQLIGAHAQIYFGNVDNSMWTDMNRPITSPAPVDISQPRKIYEYHNEKGLKYEAAAKPIRNTPWQVMVEFSEYTMLETAYRYLRWVIFIGGALILLSIFVAWRMSRNITMPLNDLAVAASSIASGNYSTHAHLDRRDEVGKLARAFNAMGAQISKAKQSLEQKIIETGEMNEQLRELSAYQQNIREEERTHIAREMHDELGQFLTGLKMDINWLKKKMPSTADNAHLQEKLVEMTSMVDEAVLFVRKLAAELRPSILDDLGLIAALEWHSQEFSRRFNIPVAFTSQVKDLPAPPNIATGLFRMYQESLTNVARHAAAKKVSANLMVSNSEIHLTVQDDGKGFDMDDTGERKTLGLLGMRERAIMIGGKLDIISKPGEGTIILINVPLKEIIAGNY